MSKNYPLVSIIIPCYNAERWILESITSCLRQTYKNIEIIVVNDGSVDDSLNIIENLHKCNPDAIKYVIGEHQGIVAARNRGIEASNGEYLLFLDADDLFLEDAVESFINTILAQRVDMAVGDWINLFDNPVHAEDYNPIPKFLFPEDPLAVFLKKPWVVSSVMIKRNNIKWKENIELWEVAQFFFNLLYENHSVGYVNKAITKIRQRQDSITILHDHFEPKRSIELFIWFKNKLRENKTLTLLRESLIDLKITGYIYWGTRREQKSFENAYKNLNISQFKKYFWYKTFGLSGFMYYLGPQLGLKVFFLINKILGRA